MSTMTTLHDTQRCEGSQSFWGSRHRAAAERPGHCHFGPGCIRSVLRLRSGNLASLWHSVAAEGEGHELGVVVGSSNASCANEFNMSVSVQAYCGHVRHNDIVDFYIRPSEGP